MKIYLFRHAQKAMDFSGDPDLTAEGHAQASRLLDKVIKGELPRPRELWVSPKKRTHSTFRQLSQHFDLQMQTHEGLLEQKADENLTEFRERIAKLFAEAATHEGSVIFMCSHYDVVVEAMVAVPCSTDLTGPEFAQWYPCQYAGFQSNPDGVFDFIELKRISL